MKVKLYTKATDLQQSIIFYVAINTHFIEMFQIAQRVKEDMDQYPIILFAGNYLDIERDEALCNAAGIAYEKLVSVSVSTGKTLQQRQKLSFSVFRNSEYMFLRLFRPLAAKIINVLTVIIGSINAVLSRMRDSPKLLRLIAHQRLTVSIILLNLHIRRVLRQLIKKHNISALILPEESFYYGTTIAVSTAKDHGIKSFIFPFSVFNHNELYEGFRHSLDFNTPLMPKFLYKLFFKKWIYRKEGSDVLYVPYYYALLQFIKGASPVDPWAPNTHPIEAVLLDTGQLIEYFSSSGIPEERIKVIGHPSDDRAYEAINDRARYLAEAVPHYDVSAHHKIFVVALPPNQIERWDEVNCGFSNHREFLSFLLEQLKKLSHHYGVIIKPHPRAKSSEITLFEDAGFAVTTSDICPLIAISDRFLAFASATIRLTGRAATKTINYDVYQYGYTEFDTFPNVTKVTSKDDFIRSIDAGITADYNTPSELDKTFDQPEQRFAVKFQNALGL